MPRPRALRAAAAALLLALAPAVPPALGPGHAASAAVEPPRAVAPPPAAPRPAAPDRAGALSLVRATLLALDQAGDTGNYTVLRDLAAPDFRAANTATRLGEIFAGRGARRPALSAAAILDPHFTLPPQIEADGRLRMAGFLPTAPAPVVFELMFALVDGRWRVSGIAVDAVPPAPAGLPSIQIR